jgi:hypothetical protein
MHATWVTELVLHSRYLVSMQGALLAEEGCITWRSECCARCIQWRPKCGVGRNAVLETEYLSYANHVPYSSLCGCLNQPLQHLHGQLEPSWPHNVAQMLAIQKEYPLPHLLDSTEGE